jgi:SAM-dependent methyltransferase
MLVAPHLGRSVLEIGAGVGHFSEKLLESRRDRVVLSDTDGQSLGQLRQKFAGRPDVEIAKITLPGRVDIGQPVDSVVAMNVLEHIEDDVQALRDLAMVVRPGGRIILWVPAYMQLYGDFDRMVGHFRRYTPTTIRVGIESAGLRLQEIRRVNMLGAIAWWLAVRAGGTRRADSRLVWLYDNLLIPTSRTIESVVPPPFGQSLLCVAQVGRS